MSGRAEDSLSFDRVAERYDDTRGDDEEIANSVGVLARALGSCRSCLEIGVGTGRIGLPLRERGFDVVGVDLSMPMMQRLRAKTTGSKPFPLAQADATRLCFARGSFDAAYAIWVLHLVGGWREALIELVRVVRPGGPVVVAFGGSFGAGPWEEIATRFKEVTGARNVGAQDADEIDSEMAALGCSVEHLTDVHRIHEVAPDEILERLDNATYSFTWVVDEATRRRGVAEVRRWAEQRFDDLSVPLRNEFGAAWRRYVTPGPA